MRWLVCLLLLATHSLGHAQTQGLPFAACFQSASDYFGVSKRMLVAIAKTESSLNPSAMGPANKDGSFDMGIMQINSSWLPKLSRFGISQRDLMVACTNIYVGAWVLAHNIQSHGNTWRAVGAYNARTTSKQVNYVIKVQRNYELVGQLFNL